MVASGPASPEYVIPRYRGPADVTWHHVLHGNVPNHQIDFMYCPEVPQGLLTLTQFSHLARLMKYIEPQTNASHAFAIGNLSRDDTQHVPGHGAVGIIFGMRIGGATDHAGRRNPPFAHGILTVDRNLNYATLLEAAATFYRHVMNAGEAHSSTADFYAEYVRAVVERPDLVLDVLERYVADFGDLPPLRRSALSWDWVADEDAQPKRLVIVHGNDEAFGTIAHAAAKIGSMLYRSDVRWTSITTGREADIPGGVSIRFVAERDLTAEERRGAILRVEDFTDNEAEIARALGAKPRDEGGEKRRYVGWRERYAAEGAPQQEGDPRKEATRPAGPAARAAHSSVPPPRESGPRQVGEHGTAVMPLVPAEEAVVRPAGVAAPAAAAAAVAGSGVAPAWRDAGGSAPPPAPASNRGASTNGAGSIAVPPATRAEASPGAEEIEVTVDKPASSSSKTWLVVAVGVVCAAAIAIVLVVGSGTTQPEAPPAPTVAPTAAPSAPAPTAAATTAPTEQVVAAPSTPTPQGPQSPPNATAGARAKGASKVPPTATPKPSGKTQPKGKKCDVFSDTLCN